MIVWNPACESAPQKAPNSYFMADQTATHRTAVVAATNRRQSANGPMSCDMRFFQTSREVAYFPFAFSRFRAASAISSADANRSGPISALNLKFLLKAGPHNGADLRCRWDMQENANPVALTE